MIKTAAIYASALILLLIAPFSAFAMESPIAPPDVKVIDEHQVNVATGQLAQNLNTVSIGGERGLSHSIQLYSALWDQGNFFGFIDRFAGSATYQKVSPENIVNILTSGGEIQAFRVTNDTEYDFSRLVHVMRVYGPVGSQDFMVYDNNGIVRNAKVESLSDYTYRAVGDQRHTLVKADNNQSVVWTTPDGTRSIYKGSGGAATGGVLSEIIYPNGLKIRINEAPNTLAVTTNTGFMLKYDFTSGLRTPDEVIAINRAEEYCSTTASSCPAGDWPKASFIWPPGTPEVFKGSGLPAEHYLFKVVDQHGSTTEIQYEPHNVCINQWGNESEHCPYDNQTKWTSRLVGIKPADSNVFKYEYSYLNIGHLQSLGHGMMFWKLGDRAGKISSARHHGSVEQNYFGPSSAQGNTRRSSNEMEVESPWDKPGVLRHVKSDRHGRYYYHEDRRKFVQKYYPYGADTFPKHYYYDGPRGNLSRIDRIVQDGNDVTVSEAVYPSTCPTEHAKTCNRPTSVTDARGHVTNYEYDPQGRHGNPIKITEPADRNGKRKTTVYHYDPKHAYYKRNSSTIEQDPDPIWLLTSEHTCRTSTATETGCEGGNGDMVKTEYYYGPQDGSANNLFLRGKSITAEGNSSTLETRVTCYQYDQYGNQIAETRPKGTASLTSCP